jgi:hypothetical protein
LRAISLVANEDRLLLYLSSFSSRLSMN